MDEMNPYMRTFVGGLKGVSVLSLAPFQATVRNFSCEEQLGIFYLLSRGDLLDFSSWVAISSFCETVGIFLGPVCPGFLESAQLSLSPLANANPVLVLS